MTVFANILVVDDDLTVQSLLDRLLSDDGHTVELAGSAREMHRAMTRTNFDLILLDLKLPDGSGVDLLRDLRLHHDTPVIMITAQNTLIDRVMGLESGADDYIGKPFEMRELLARVHSVLRRSKAAVVQQPHFEDTVLRFGDWSLDVTHRNLSHARHGEVSLTTAEFDLLKLLAESPNRPLSRDELMAATKEREWNPFDRSIDVLVGRLRKKIEQDAARPSLIKTVRNVGYILATRVDRELRPDQMPQPKAA